MREIRRQSDLDRRFILMEREGPIDQVWLVPDPPPDTLVFNRGENLVEVCYFQRARRAMGFDEGYEPMFRTRKFAPASLLSPVILLQPNVFMLNHRVCLLLLLAFLPSSVRADKPDLPSPPAGFDWQWCDEVRVGILKPQQWHFLSQSKNETRGYFITKEKIHGTGKFDTGLSLNVIPNVGKKQGGEASNFAKSFIREAIQDKQSVLQIIPPGEVGPAKTFGCRIRRHGSIVHYFLITDDSQDILYLFMFESPESEWESAWKIGETMLRKLYVDFPDK